MSNRDWRELHRAATLELNPVLLRIRVEAAEAAIVYRLETLETHSSSVDERQAISDALSSLRHLKKESRKWSAPEGTKVVPTEVLVEVAG